MLRILPLLALVAGLVLLVLAVMPRPDDAPATPGAGAVAPSLAAGPLPSAPEEAAGPERAPVEPTAPEVAVPSARTPEASVAAERGVTLELVRAADGAPCAGAQVFALDAAGLTHDAYRAEVATGADHGEALARLARLFLADGAGQVAVPAPRGDLVVRAVLGELVAHATVPAPHAGQRVRLELEAPRSLLVRVVDGEGAPVGEVPVELRGWRDRWSHGLLVGHTDDAGQVVLREVPAVLRQHGAQDERFTVSLDLPLAEPVHHPVDPAALPAEPIELVLPPTGSVLVRLFDAQDQPVRAPRLVNLQLDTYPDTPYDGGWNRGIAGRLLYGTNVLARDGVARFPHVGLGLPLKAHAAVLGTQNMDGGMGPGPAAAGETVVIEVRPFENQRVITGRIVAPGGAPIGARRLVGLFLAPERSLSFWVQEGASTEADGVFRISIAVGVSLPATLVLQSPPERADEPVLEAPLALPGDLPLGTTDVGDLRLTPAPLLAAGRVRFADGSPAPGCTVEFGYPGVLFGRTQTDLQLYELRCRTDAAGRFEAHGSLPGYEEASLRVIHPDTPSVRRVFRPGEDDLEVVLVASGGLAGSLLLDPSVQPGDLRLDCTWTEAGGATRGTRLPLDAEGRFEEEGLPAGPVDLRLALDYQRTNLGEDPLWAQPTEVVAGELHRDPRLQQVDLRHVRFHRVTCRDRDGERVRFVVLQADQEDLFQYLQGDRDGAVAVPSWSAVEGWLVHARGYRTLAIPRVSEDTELTLEPALAVRLALVGGAPPAGHELSVWAHPTDRDAEPFELGANASFDGGRAELFLQRPGRYRLAYRLYRPDHSKGTDLSEDDGLTPRVLEVVDTPGGRAVEVLLPPDGLAAAAERLRDGE